MDPTQFARALTILENLKNSNLTASQLRYVLELTLLLGAVPTKVWSVIYKDTTHEIVFTQKQLKKRIKHKDFYYAVEYKNIEDTVSRTGLTQTEIQHLLKNI